MNENQLAEIYQIQQDYENKRITFQQFKESFIKKLIGYSSVEDIEDIVSFILEN